MDNDQAVFIDQVVELFHPDMNYSDIVRAIKNITASVRSNREALWEDKKTQLERDQEPRGELRDQALGKVDAIAKLFPEAIGWDAVLQEIERLQAIVKSFELLASKYTESLSEDVVARALDQSTLIDALALVTDYDTANAVHEAIRNALRQAVIPGGRFWDNYAREYMKEVLEKYKGAAVAPSPAAEPAPKPFAIMLHCPLCHTKHVDEGEFATKPHHTHSCQGFVTDSTGRRRRCGHTWRPAKEPTVGVEYIEGFVNPITGEELVGKRVRILNHKLDEMDSVSPYPPGIGVVSRFDGPYHNKGEERYFVNLGIYGIKLKREEFEAL